MTGFVVKC